MDDQQAARVARLAARGRSTVAATPPESRPARRRRHAAEASRVLAAGISTSAFMGALTGLAAHAPATGTASSARAATLAVTPSTIVRERDVTRIVLVDRFGRPLRAGAASAPTSPGTPTAPGRRGASATSPAARSGTGGATASNPPPASGRGTVPAPGGGTAPPTATAPPTVAPSTSPPTTPATTAPPTTAPPPPPTTVPSCTGSKCPKP